jgi:hypothetical protein
MSDEVPSEKDVDYPGGAPAKRRDEFLQGRYPGEKETEDVSTEPSEEMADIVRTVAWQSDLFKSLRRLRPLDQASAVIETSDQFVQAHQAHPASGLDYSSLISRLLSAFRTTADTLGIDVRDEIEAMESNLGASPTALHEAHRSYLIKLNSLL